MTPARSLSLTVAALTVAAFAACGTKDTQTTPDAAVSGAAAGSAPSVGGTQTPDAGGQVVTVTATTDA